ncbi:hypothetical protein B0H11DRAFT_755152 [Mycena galericulata]|nr:hypothetical protein B0H11DRAFT_755152 [Mycena galericulata]
MALTPFLYLIQSACVLGATVVRLHPETQMCGALIDFFSSFILEIGPSQCEFGVGVWDKFRAQDVVLVSERDWHRTLRRVLVCIYSAAPRTEEAGGSTPPEDVIHSPISLLLAGVRLNKVTRAMSSKSSTGLIQCIDDQLTQGGIGFVSQSVGFPSSLIELRRESESQWYLTTYHCHRVVISVQP